MHGLIRRWWPAEPEEPASRDLAVWDTWYEVALKVQLCRLKTLGGVLAAAIVLNIVSAVVNVAG